HRDAGASAAGEDVAGVEDQAAVAERDLVAVLEAELADAAAVHVGAVGAAEVLEQEAVAHLLQGGVLLRHLAVRQAEGVRGVPAQRGAGAERELAQLAVQKPPGEVRPAGAGPDRRHLARGERLSAPRAPRRVRLGERGSTAWAGTEHRTVGRCYKPFPRAHQATTRGLQRPGVL